MVRLGSDEWIGLPVVATIRPADFPRSARPSEMAMGPDSSAAINCSAEMASGTSARHPCSSPCNGSAACVATSNNSSASLRARSGGGVQVRDFGSHWAVEHRHIQPGLRRGLLGQRHVGEAIDQGLLLVDEIDEAHRRHKHRIVAVLGLIGRTRIGTGLVLMPAKRSPEARPRHRLPSSARASPAELCVGRGNSGKDSPSALNGSASLTAYGRVRPLPGSAAEVSPPEARHALGQPFAKMAVGIERRAVHTRIAHRRFRA